MGAGRPQGLGGLGGLGDVDLGCRCTRMSLTAEGVSSSHYRGDGKHFAYRDGSAGSKELWGTWIAGGPMLMHRERLSAREQRSRIIVTQNSRSLRCIDWSRRSRRQTADVKAFYVHFPSSGSGAAVQGSAS